MIEKSLNSLTIAATDALDTLISRHRLLEIASTSESEDMRLLLNVYLQISVEPLSELASTLDTIKRIVTSQKQNSD